MSDTQLHFPKDFMWGTATAAYQVEGAATEDRVPSIWDRFSHIPGKIHNNDTGDVACDHYHRYKEDIRSLIVPLNIRYYRFSIAWPRVQTFPSEAPAQENAPGIAFYNALIDTLLENNVVPVVTLYHWDLPVAVQDKYDGWAGDPEIADAFASYAELCFRHFGHKVKWWITLNEPWCSSVLGYEVGEHAPGDASAPGVRVYKAAHNLLRAHAKAVQVYRTQFQQEQAGKIGITLNSVWAEPSDPENADAVAGAERALDFELGWYADPVYFGDYPAIMREVVGDRLPKFTEEEQELLRNSSDFFGLNHYSTTMVRGVRKTLSTEPMTHWRDRGTEEYAAEEWGKTDMGWAIVPWGLTKLLEHVQTRYSPEGGIVVTENGLAVREETVGDALKDSLRVEFYQSYISGVHAAINGEKKADVRGYFLWSLMDNYEWAKGYSKRFGLYYVDYESQKRTAKPAVAWYAQVVKANAVPKTLEKDV